MPPRQVLIVIDGDTVIVDGSPLPQDPFGRAPYDVAIAHCASAAGRFRPVAAEIVESFGTTTCQVLRDGTTRGLRFAYNAAGADLEVPAPAGPVVLPVPTRTTRDTRAADRTRLPLLQYAGLALVGLALAALATLWAVRDGSTSPTGALAATTPQRVLPAFTVAPGQSLAPLPVLDIEAEGGVGAIEFMGERGPVQVQLTGPVTQELTLELTRAGVVVDDLPAGEYHWVARAEGRAGRRGTVTVAAPAPAYTPSAEPTREPSPQPPSPPETFEPPIDPDRT